MTRYNKLIIRFVIDRQTLSDRLAESAGIILTQYPLSFDDSPSVGFLAHTRLLNLINKITS
jgi:hypothetical protein